MPTLKTCKIWKALGLAVLMCLLVTACVAVTYAVILSRGSRALLNAARSINVGGVLDARTIEIAKQMNAIAYVKPPEGSPAVLYQYFYVDPSHWVDTPYATAFVPVSFDRCMTDFCAVSFPASKLQADRVYEFLTRHPKPFLPVFYWVYSKQNLHRWLPLAWLDPVTIIVTKGVVQELDVRMRSEAIAGEGCPRAETRISRALLSGGSSWEVTTTSVMHTGGDCGIDLGIRVNATAEATPEQLTDALEFNPRCLLPGGYCKKCDMLPMICEHNAGSIRHDLE